MELAKLTSRCQLTLPREIRQKLGVKEGDKVVFIEGVMTSREDSL